MTTTLLASDQSLRAPVAEPLGHLTVRTDIRSSLGPFSALPTQVEYPSVVVDALGELFTEYNTAFAPLVAANREWGTDYQFCQPPNFAVQIDMVGLTAEFLDEAAGLPVDEVRERLRGMIFEIENSVAMYQVLERLFANNGTRSFFSAAWRAVLDGLRQRHGRPIALLAVTDHKYGEMAGAEFGVPPEGQLTNREVAELSGFDALFGPGQFLEYLRSTGGECEYLLYVRSSEPVAKLRKPEVEVEHPLLGDPDIRRLIKAQALTLNVDGPDMDPARWINDTKAYMPELGLGHHITTWEDLDSPEFEDYLSGLGISLAAVHAGEVPLRGKPLKASYGGYGHVRGVYPDRRLRASLRRNLRVRPGGYVVQPEMDPALVTNSTTGVTAGYIDRNFFGVIDGQPVYTGGFRNFMPVDSSEYQAGRIHGNGDAFWAEIVPS